MLTELGMLNLKPPKACGEILKFTATFKILKAVF